MRHKSIRLGAVLVCLLGSLHAQTESTALDNCLFKNLDLVAGMPRARVEEQVASALGRENTYSPYGNNLPGGLVQYSDGIWVLEVTYKSGSPAPWVANKNGELEHLEPIDETLLAHRIYHSSSKNFSGCKTL